MKNIIVVLVMLILVGCAVPNTYSFKKEKGEILVFQNNTPIEYYEARVFVTKGEDKEEIKTKNLSELLVTVIAGVDNNGNLVKAKDISTIDLFFDRRDLTKEEITKELLEKRETLEKYFSQLIDFEAELKFNKSDVVFGKLRYNAIKKLAKVDCILKNINNQLNEEVTAEMIHLNKEKLNSALKFFKEHIYDDTFGFKEEFRNIINEFAHLILIKEDSLKQMRKTALQKITKERTPLKKETDDLRKIAEELKSIKKCGEEMKKVIEDTSKLIEGMKKENPDKKQAGDLRDSKKESEK